MVDTKKGFTYPVKMDLRAFVFVYVTNSALSDQKEAKIFFTLTFAGVGLCEFRIYCVKLYFKLYLKFFEKYILNWGWSKLNVNQMGIILLGNNFYNMCLLKATCTQHMDQPRLLLLQVICCAIFIIITIGSEDI